MSLILAIDTTERTAHVALSDHNALCLHLSTEDGFVAEQLINLIDRILTEAQVPTKEITAVSVALGPGSFTGIRTGIATAQGIAFGLDIDVLGVSVLLARILPHIESQNPSVVVASLRANPRETFFAVYGVTPNVDKSCSRNCVLINDLALEPLCPILTAKTELLELTVNEECDARLSGDFAGLPPQLFRLDSVEQNFANPAALLAKASVLELSGTLPEFQRLYRGIGLGPLYVKKPGAKTLLERGILTLNRD